MPRKNNQSQDLSVVLHSDRIVGDVSRAELEPIVGLGRKPISREWAYRQSFDSLVSCHCMLGQILGASELVELAKSVEGFRSDRKTVRLVRNIKDSIDVVAQVMREKARRRA